MNDDAAMTAEAIRASRERLGLTQAEFARRVGCAQSAVSMWEDGIRTPRGLYAKAVRRLMKEAARKQEGERVNE